MPRRTPDRWFDTLVLLWIVFATLMPTKIYNYFFQDEPAQTNEEKHVTKSWTWPW
uniref:ATP synthase complex subunit 8 n=1 Tax=Abbottina rivularis TaxID=75332 RepID=A0A7D5ATL5_ABBRI|nr:ATP synthase F0 subunit 8 [Abbottina rivularis]